MVSQALSKQIDKLKELAQELADIEVSLPDIDLSGLDEEDWADAEAGEYGTIEDICQSALVVASEEIFEQTVRIRGEIKAVAQELSLLQRDIDASIPTFER